MKQHKLLVLVAASGLLGGCATTITSRGEIYTQAYWQEPALVVETYTPAVVVPLQSHPIGPIASGPRHHRPAVRPGPGLTNPKPPTNRPLVRAINPGKNRLSVRGSGAQSRPTGGSLGKSGSQHDVRGPQQASRRPQGRK